MRCDVMRSVQEGLRELVASTVRESGMTTKAGTELVLGFGLKKHVPCFESGATGWHLPHKRHKFRSSRERS